MLADMVNVLSERLVGGAVGVEQPLPRLRRVAGANGRDNRRRSDRYTPRRIGDGGAVFCSDRMSATAAELLFQGGRCGVPVLPVRNNALETVEATAWASGKTRLGQETKLKRFETLFDEQ